jgi:hypothetical protein
MAHYYKPWFFDMKVKGSDFIKIAEILIAIRYDITGGHP